MSRPDNPGKRHPLYRAIRAAWWVLALWLAGAVLFGVIRGTFVTGPAPEVKPPTETSPER